MEQTILPDRRRKQLLKRSIYTAVFAIVACYLTGRVTPPIFGCVVDAVSHRPIRGIYVVVEESHFVGWAVHTDAVRVARTNRFGWFFLLPTYHWSPGGPLSDFRAYWLSVNESENGTSGSDESSAQADVLYNPMFNRGGWAIGSGNYFPLTVTFSARQCDRIWTATCSPRWSWWGLTVPLIPVLDDPKVCGNISSSALRENCRQLNTYHAAFVHVDSYEEVQRGKQLCSEVDHAIYSRECIQQLPTYIAMVYTYSPQYHSPAYYEPIPEGMFPDTLAGISVMSNKHCGPKEFFSGRVRCGAGYALGLTQQISISIEDFPDPADSQGPIVWRPDYADSKQATITFVRLPGGDVYRYHGPQYNSFYWYSGTKHIEVFFYHPIPQMLSIVSYYLKLYPSSLV